MSATLRKWGRIASVLECVINISEGRRLDVVSAIADQAGADLLDVHSCAEHNRSVLTVVGETAPRAITRAAVELLDIRDHQGAHPRIGVVDVVPFVPLASSSMAEAIAARDSFARWAAHELQVPCFTYGPTNGSDEAFGTGRTLPDIRRNAFASLTPETGPVEPHPTAGAIAVGARDVLVAYNLWLSDGDLDQARSIAAAIRSSRVRALGMQVGADVQVSLNLIAPDKTGPAEVHDFVAARARIARAELVGLIPRSVLEAVKATRWEGLDVRPDNTIEARLAEREHRLRRNEGDVGSSRP
jgi:glutamate formiminotransferase